MTKLKPRIKLATGAKLTLGPDPLACSVDFSEGRQEAREETERMTPTVITAKPAKKPVANALF